MFIDLYTNFVAEKGESDVPDPSSLGASIELCIFLIRSTIIPFNGSSFTDAAAA